MPRNHRPPPTSSSLTSSLPAGAPAWVTEELLSDTIVAWQPYYAEDLTADDALKILLAAGRLFDALGDAQDEEKQVPGSGSRQ
jgi:hypothetical protein